MSHYYALTRLLLITVITLGTTHGLTARFLVGGMSFQEMFEKSDLVVIATAVRSKETTERKRLVDIDTIPTSRPDLLQDEVIGVETEFVTRVALKGPKDLKKFVLHHYKFANGNDETNGPQFIQIPSGRHATFLMFLIKQKNERYAPVTGQFDPAVLSIFEIMEAAPDKPVE